MKSGKQSLTQYRSEKTDAGIERDSKPIRSAYGVADSCGSRLAGDAYDLSFRHVFDTAADGMCIIDLDYNVLEMSRLLQDSIGLPSPMEGSQKCYDVVGGAECHTSRCPLTMVKESNQSIELEVSRGFGEEKVYILSGSPLRSPEGRVVGIIEHFKDITEISKTQQLLQRKVEELEAEKRNVDQKNAALNELLGKLERGRKEVAGQVRANLDQMVFPVLETIRGNLDPSKKNLVSVLSSCLMDITGPYVSSLRRFNSSLSAAELEICSMIREGFTTKQIATVRDVSTATVIDQRKTIRKKLGIARTDTNLSSFLKSLQHNDSK